MISILAGGCGGYRSKAPITRSGFYFDTLISITIYAYEDNSILDECFNMCDRYEQLLSMTVEESDISRINAAGTEPVYVSSDTVYLLEKAFEYRALSEGRLDISVAPLSALWTKARSSKTPPQDEEIDSLIPLIGLEGFTVDAGNCCVSKSDPDAMLDIGALGKGYVADKLKEMLTNRGVTSAIISLGGNILTIGSKPDGSDYHIGIKKPFSDNEAAVSLSISDKSVVTSGVYERYFINNDKLYHHILDPETGSPCETDLLSATIISDSSLDGDALSTICLLYGLDGAMDLINKTPGVEAILISQDNKLHYTGGAESYLSN